MRQTRKLAKMVPLRASVQPIRVFVWCVALPASSEVSPLHVDSETNSTGEHGVSIYIYIFYIRQAKSEKEREKK